MIDNENIAFHFEAKGGHLMANKLIIEDPMNGNPANEDGNTSLHFAAKYNHFKICKLIIENVTDMNPGNYNVSTSNYGWFEKFLFRDSLKRALQESLVYIINTLFFYL